MMETKTIQRDIAMYLTIYDYLKISKEELTEQMKEMSKEQLIEHIMFPTGENFKILPETLNKVVKISEHFGRFKKETKNISVKFVSVTVLLRS